MHRAGEDGGLGAGLRASHVHLGDERERLVGGGLQVRPDPLPLRREVTVHAQGVELGVERRLGALLGDRDRGEGVGVVGRAVLEHRLAGLVE